jgi:hypothetical protein
MQFAIRVSGPWDAHADELLAGVDMHVEGETRVLSADLDQAALQGLLQRIEVLGLNLIEVRRVRTGQASR